MDYEISEKKLKGYRLFAAFYNFRARLPFKKKGVFFVMTHDGGMTGNCGSMMQKVRAKGYRTYFLNRAHTDFGKNIFGAFRFFVIKSFQMGSCRTVFLDNAFLPLGFCNVPEDVQIAMLWHGTGTIKRFGLDTTEGGLKELEQGCYSKITHLFVASEYTKQIYKGCFGLPYEKIFVTGSPRCDELFEAHDYNDDIRDKDKFTVLFATTFRENIPGDAPYYEIRTLLRKLQSKNRKIQVLLRLHPHVAHELKGRSEYFMFGNCVDVSGQDNLNMIMRKADILVTDYSSICYDFAILERPVLFYAPDLDYYRDAERGFYEDYDSFVPGPVFRRIDALADEILKLASDPAKHDSVRSDVFMEKAFAHRDSNAAFRIMEVLKL
ncbi:MAG: CDP-glycerol glycerophosphotransferase family protein [Lachnospiraceae bacterium]|nr:CDP-glycerol glycerophosphotransferase family protein [Lachnospiraceae bacterium]